MTRTAMNEVAELGQSIWLDFIDGELLQSGRLIRLVGAGLRGLTSNPSIFEKAIGQSTAYDERISALQPLEAHEILDRLMVEDIQRAADILLPVYRQSQNFRTPYGLDGFVSLEVSPLFARNPEKTLLEARRLWKEVERPNLMIKVPGTPECLPVIQQLLSEAINVNVTLLFSRALYSQVIEAHRQGLEERLSNGQPIDSISSVASFFVSRVDVAVDALLKVKSPQSKYFGKAGISNARLAYRDFLQSMAQPRWQKLKSQGAHPQRLLWASTETKSPNYSDVLYVEGLIAPCTVNTLPPQTLEAFENHGRVHLALSNENARNELIVREAENIVKALEELQISLDLVTERLLDEGIAQFKKPYERLAQSIESKRAHLKPKAREPALALNPATFKIPAPLQIQIDSAAKEWDSEELILRLWNGDPALWSGRDENRWIGWMSVISREKKNLPELDRFSAEIHQRGYKDAVLLGMGGSSLTAEILSRVFKPSPGFPALKIIDTSQPDQIRRISSTLDWERTLFIVSSKSGKTLEPNLLKDYFLAEVKKAIGEERAPQAFIAITDPGTPLDQAARAEGFLKVFYGEPAIGGRYSALSDFGMVPFSIQGLDTGELLDQAERMSAHCRPGSEKPNPGVALGVALGVLAREGRDKVTIFASPEIAAIGSWIEQLLAESTGKEGKGLIPIIDEPIGNPDQYGLDRQFYYFRLSDGAPDASPRFMDEAVQALVASGHPVVQIDIQRKFTHPPYSLAQEFFRWEMATAVAGSLLKIDPFDQPDVEAAKVEARKLTDRYERSGELPVETPFFADRGLAFYAEDKEDKVDLGQPLTSARTSAGVLASHLQRIQPADYFALLAFIDKNPENVELIQKIRLLIRNHLKVATCVGFGPTFLHSTGQLFKGGPKNGVFLEITARGQSDLPITGHRYGFDVVQRAQSRGDLEVLKARGRELLRIDLGNEVTRGLERLLDILPESLKSLEVPKQTQTQARRKAV